MFHALNNFFSLLYALLCTYFLNYVANIISTDQFLFCTVLYQQELFIFIWGFIFANHC